jgi:hypothetical protein
MEEPVLNNTVQGNPSVDQKWEFRLVAQDPTNPMPEGSDSGVKSLFITGSGSAKFGAWSYSAPGTYVYKVFQQTDGIDGYACDQAIYTITDYVTAGDGILRLNRVVTNEANKNVVSLDFVNKFSAPVQPQPTPIISAVPILGETGTDVAPFVIGMVVAFIGAMVCFFFIILWKRRKDDDDEEVTSVEA